ncbi:MAG: hypothetical protein BRC58_01860 [Cyanobacteria bacterium QS_8_64_29]|nr:MAG: hypothetical protein BRC58_01860 [Cyanobacteria bacterium QS_8_64_29]
MDRQEQLKAWSAKLLATAGFEPGKDFSAAGGKLYCSRRASQYLQAMAPSNFARPIADLIVVADRKAGPSGP